MSRAPTVPPRAFPIADENGMISDAWYRYLTGERSYSTNVNSGVTAAQAAAATAQATATAATAVAQAASVTAQAAATNAFSVTISDTNAFVLSAALGVLTTNSVTVTASGGTAPYTYAWTRVSGDIVTINAAAAATTTFSGDPGVGGSLSGIYKCTVTDAVAAVSVVSCGVTIINESFSG